MPESVFRYADHQSALDSTKGVGQFLGIYWQTLVIVAQIPVIAFRNTGNNSSITAHLLMF